MQQMNRSGHSAWPFTLRMIWVVATTMIGLSIWQNGNAGKMLLFWVSSAWTDSGQSRQTQ